MLEEFYFIQKSRAHGLWSLQVPSHQQPHEVNAYKYTQQLNSCVTNKYTRARFIKVKTDCGCAVIEGLPERCAVVTALTHAMCSGWRGSVW